MQGYILTFNIKLGSFIYNHTPDVSVWMNVDRCHPHFEVMCMILEDIGTFPHFIVNKNLFPQELSIRGLRKY